MSQVVIWKPLSSVAYVGSGCQSQRTNAADDAPPKKRLAVAQRCSDLPLWCLNSELSADCRVSAGMCRRWEFSADATPTINNQNQNDIGINAEKHSFLCKSNNSQANEVTHVTQNSVKGAAARTRHMAARLVRRIRRRSVPVRRAAVVLVVHL